LKYSLYKKSYATIDQIGYFCHPSSYYKLRGRQRSFTAPETVILLSVYSRWGLLATHFQLIALEGVNIASAIKLMTLLTTRLFLLSQLISFKANHATRGTSRGFFFLLFDKFIEHFSNILST